MTRTDAEKATLVKKFWVKWALANLGKLHEGALLGEKGESGIRPVIKSLPTFVEPKDAQDFAIAFIGEIGPWKLNQAEIDDIILLLEHHIESGEDGIERQFCLVGEQPEDMMNNLQSALQKLQRIKS